MSPHQEARCRRTGSCLAHDARHGTWETATEEVGEVVLVLNGVVFYWSRLVWIQWSSLGSASVTGWREPAVMARRSLRALAAMTCRYHCCL
jgi:hypothetical protein